MRHFARSMRDGSHHVVYRTPGTPEGCYTSVMQCPDHGTALGEAARLNQTDAQDQRALLAERKLVDRKARK